MHGYGIFLYISKLKIVARTKINLLKFGLFKIAVFSDENQHV